MWQDAGASWPRPCFEHYDGEPTTERRLRTPLLVLDKPDALGETWCWRFSIAVWCVVGVALVALALVGVL
jgi:hypothetical protein